MSKGLESLETLKFEMADNKFFQKHELYLPKYENDYDEILKEIEEDEDYQIVEKELKALEIIKKYIRVDKPFGSACYIYLNDESEMIPEEQFDLLKEVLS